MKFFYNLNKTQKQNIILLLFLFSVLLFFLHFTRTEPFLTKKQRRKLKKGISKAGNAVASAGKAVGTGIVGLSQQAGTGIVDVAEQAGSGIVGLGDDIIDAFNLNILSDAIKGISNSFKQISTSINSLGQQFEESVSQMEDAVYAI